MKIIPILWIDNTQTRTYSIIFGGLIYHVIYGTVLDSLEEVEEKFNIDIGMFLTELMYCAINENEEYEKGNVQLLEDFNPFEIIEEGNYTAKYLRRGFVGGELMSESVCRIYEC